MDTTPNASSAAAPDVPPAQVTLAQAFLYWFKLGFISFGGPVGQIAIMHQDLVEKKRWISEKRFLHALNFCMVLPGPEAQQLATYIGWLMHRTWGGIIAGGMFVLPSFFILVGLSWVYMAYGTVPAIAGVFYGIKPAVVAIVLFAAFRIGSRVLNNGVMWCIAVLAFVAIFIFRLPFPAIVLAAGVIGYFGGRMFPEYFKAGGGHGKADKYFGPSLIDDDMPTPAHALFSWSETGSRGFDRRCHLGSGHGNIDCELWLGKHLYPDGLVLHQGGLADLWRSLCRSALCLSGRSGTIPLADTGADDRWAGSG